MQNEQDVLEIISLTRNAQLNKKISIHDVLPNGKTVGAFAVAHVLKNMRKKRKHLDYHPHRNFISMHAAYLQHQAIIINNNKASCNSSSSNPHQKEL
jgi:hypothetical protein